MKKIRTIKIGKREIGEGKPTFVVAEMSANHDQNFKKAVSIIKAAARAGADAIKLQTFTPDTMTIDSREKWFWVGGENNPKSWKGQTFYDLYKKAYTPWEWFPRLKKIAEDLGLVFFSTPFDVTAVDFLEKLKMPAYKIAAYESIDIPLLKRVAKTGKPIIVSVGFSTLDEVCLTVDSLRKFGAKDIVILQCTTSYKDKPIPNKTNLKTMLDYKKRFNVVAGLSDNMGGIEVPVLEALLGASVIEKHLVLKHGKALDDRFSLDEKEFKEMVEEIRRNELKMNNILRLTPVPEGHTGSRFALKGKSLFGTRTRPSNGTGLVFAGHIISDQKRQEILRANIKLSKRQETMLGKVKYGPQTPEEKYNRNFRRSLFVVADIKKGEKFSEKNVRSIRPGYGLAPKYFGEILKKIARVDIKKNTPLSLKLIKK